MRDRIGRCRMAGKTVVNINGRVLPLSNLDKVLWPDEKIAKRDLIAYYAEISSFMLPYLKDRPVVLTRYPDGIHGKAFFQKEMPKPAPDWVRTFPVFHRDTSRTVNYVLVDEPATLVWTANLACIEMHCWQSSIHSLDNPDWAVFDLDPAEGATFADVKVVAGLVRQAIAEFGLEGYPKTSGATGLHIFMPLKPVFTYAQVQAAVRFIAMMVRDAFPQKVTLERAVKDRAGKVYIDFLQNSKGKTMVSVFSCRPKPGATVSFPIPWEVLDTADPARYTIFTAPEEIKRMGDPFKDVLRLRQDLASVLHATVRTPGAGGFLKES